MPLGPKSPLHATKSFNYKAREYHPLGVDIVDIEVLAQRFLREVMACRTTGPTPVRGGVSVSTPTFRINVVTNVQAPGTMGAEPPWQNRAI